MAKQQSHLITTLMERAFKLPVSATLQADLPAIGDFIADSDHYDRVDEELLIKYREVLQVKSTLTSTILKTPLFDLSNHV